MISRLIGGFVAILLGASLIGPISTEVNSVTIGTNSTGGCSSGYCTALYNNTGWGVTVLQLVPGFFALGILGIGIAVTYGSLRDAGVV